MIFLRDVRTIQSMHRPDPATLDYAWLGRERSTGCFRACAERILSPASSCVDASFDTPSPSIAEFDGLIGTSMKKLRRSSSQFLVRTPLVLVFIQWMDSACDSIDSFLFELLPVPMQTSKP
jgi:hypothetical protein